MFFRLCGILVNHEASIECYDFNEHLRVLLIVCWKVLSYFIVSFRIYINKWSKLM